MKKHSQFLPVFVSEFVEILTDFNINTPMQATDEGFQAIEVPLTVTGFVMDVDDTFVYLSLDGEKVNQALPIDSIKHIAIVDLAKEEEILDSIDIPEDGSFH